VATNNKIVKKSVEVLTQRLGYRISQEQLALGIQKNLPCRGEETPRDLLEKFQKNLLSRNQKTFPEGKLVFDLAIFDVCHNFQGLDSSLRKIEARLGSDVKINFLISMKKGKGLKELRPLLERRIIGKILPIKSESDFSMGPEDLRNSLMDISAPVAEKVRFVDGGDVEKVLEYLYLDAVDRSGLEGDGPVADECLLIAGSFYIMAQVRKHFGFTIGDYDEGEMKICSPQESQKMNLKV
jgi:folylpolyglutamate synthase/dihydropteroate synthase